LFLNLKKYLKKIFKPVSKNPISAKNLNQSVMMPLGKIVNERDDDCNIISSNITQTNQFSLIGPAQKTERTPVQMIHSEGVINTNQTENNVHRNHSNPMIMQQDVPRNTVHGGLNFNNLKSCDFFSKFSIIVCSLLYIKLIYSKIYNCILNFRFFQSFQSVLVVGMLMNI